MLNFIVSTKTFISSNLTLWLIWLITTLQSIKFLMWKLFSCSSRKEDLPYGVSKLGNEITEVSKITWFLRKTMITKKKKKGAVVLRLSRRHISLWFPPCLFLVPPNDPINARAPSLVSGYQSFPKWVIAWNCVVARLKGKFLFCIKMCKVSQFFGAHTLTGGFSGVPLYIFVHFHLGIDLVFSRSIGSMIGRIFNTWQLC